METGDVERKTNIANTHVPDKVYAFMIQAHHMLYELLDCKKGDVVSLEVFDDVGVEHRDGTKEAIQVKSVLSSRNPVSDKSVDLWKTLYNWMIAVQSNELDVECCKFILFITTNKSGTVVTTFQEAITTDTAEQAWRDIRNLFYNETGKLKKLGNEYEDYLSYFFDIRNKELACKIIQRFQIKKCIFNYSEEVRKKFDNIGIPEDIIEPIYKAIIGWIDLQIAHIVEDKKPIVISYEAYLKEINALYREYNQKHSLISCSRPIDDQEVDREFQKQRIYIEQLDVIECDYTEKIEAINDYIQASMDNTIWADNGDVSHRSIEKYKGKLKRSWELQKRIVMLGNKLDTPEEQGKMIYYKCQDKKINMDVFDVPESFQNGCFHMLSDDLIIGWHPSYKTVLAEKGKING